MITVPEPLYIQYSATTPEVHNILYCRHSRTECTKYFNEIWTCDLRYASLQTASQTDRQTYRRDDSGGSKDPQSQKMENRCTLTICIITYTDAEMHSTVV